MWMVIKETPNIVFVAFTNLQLNFVLLLLQAINYYEASLKAGGQASLR